MSEAQDLLSDIEALETKLQEARPVRGAPFP